MPKGIYKHKKTQGFQKGHIVSESQKEKQRLKMLGRIPWNKGVSFNRGKSHPMFGKHHSKATKEKMHIAQIERFKKNPTWNKGLKGFMKQTEMVKKLISQKNTGKNNYHWKGGVSRAYKTGYYSVEYKKWREAVMKRDNFTCQKCGKKRCYLTAHHIRSFAKYPELRYERANGITLCEKCHEKTDNYKGKAKKN
jgi:5-methylcytosine-specific restriction endonuclease McrA